ncbi:MAG: hypothetical protein R3F56_19910 [Planctomycetota bacterium]
MKLSKLSLTLTLPCVLATSVAAQWREAKQIKNTVCTTLSQVRAHPDAYRNVKVQFDIQFATLGGISNPFFTQFVPTDFANFHAWAVEQPIWRKQAFDDVFGLLFISKSSDQLQELYNTSTFQRLRVTGLVRNTFQNQPWIEVTEYDKLDEQVGWATLSHLYRADQWMERRQWQQALSELSLASQGSNPSDVLSEIYKTMGVCYLRVGESERALAHLQSAKKMAGERPDPEIEGLIATASLDPSRELDRAVNKTEIREFERPMWEVFEVEGRTVTPPAQPQR